MFMATPRPPTRALDRGLGAVLLSVLLIAASELTWIDLGFLGPGPTAIVALEPIIAASRAPIDAVLVTLGYPAVDILICTVALLGWTRAARHERPPLLLLAIAFGFATVSDSALAFQLLRGNASVPTTFDVGYLLAALLISAAAWHSGRHRIGGPSHGTVASPREPATPCAAMALALTGAVARLFIHRPFASEVQIFGIVVLATSAIALLVHRHDVVQTLRRSRATEAGTIAAQ